MPLASSPALNHQPAVHPHEPGIHLTTSLAGGVVPVLVGGFRIGVGLFPCGSVCRFCSPSPGMGRESPGTLSVLRHRSCRTFGVFLDRLGCRRPIDLTSCLAFPIRLTGCP